MRVLLSVSLHPYTGYGKDGLAITDLFLRAGFDVHLEVDTIAAPQPPHIAHLLTKTPPTGEGAFDLFLKQYDPGRLKSHPADKFIARTVIGWTMWEWTDLDVKLHDQTIAELNQRYEHFDAIACYDEVTRGAIQPWTDRPLVCAQGGYDSIATRQVQRDFSARPFKFAMYGALTPRKGPFYAIQAFTNLCERRPDLDIELTLKTTERGLHPGIEQAYPGVHIINEIWTQEKLDQWIADQHCLVCPSLGEGKNMAALEFLASGGPVIATNWGGMSVWMSDQYAFPLRSTVVKEAPTKRAMRAEPDVAHLSELMELVATDQAEVHRRADNALRLVPDLFGWDRTVVGMLERVGDQTSNSVAKEVAADLRLGLDIDRQRRERAASLRAR